MNQMDKEICFLMFMLGRHTAIPRFTEIGRHQRKITHVDDTIIVEIGERVIADLNTGFAECRRQQREITDIDEVVAVGVAFEHNAGRGDIRPRGDRQGHLPR